MRTDELTEALIRAHQEEGTFRTLVRGITSDGTVYEIHALDVEHHDDGSCTVWLRLDES